MSTNPNTDSPHDYPNADKFLHDLDQWLGQIVIVQAEDITNDSGEEAPLRIVREAERLTIRAGIVEPQNVLDEAEAISIHAAEVDNVGENLPPNAVLDPTVADGAARVLHSDSVKKAFAGQNSMLRLAYEYDISKAKTQAEIDAVNRQYPSDSPEE